MQATLDVLREKYPHLGFALYAYAPGGAVTLECITAEGRTFTFTGPSEDAAIRAGFADDFAERPAPAERAPSVFD